ncbi:MAG: enolase C-terminal domain-like protein, partial [Ignavibacteria bacterium]|nr:enolase C-terminal domain-like protein [Ignavibacteria bacterium]
MKITNVETILLTGPCTNDPFITGLRKVRSAAIIRIHTDGGLVGIGETYAGYFFPDGVPPIVEFFKPILVGNNVDDIPELWNRMYHCGNFWCRVGLGAIVLAGIEAALWDLKGKEMGLPVYKILGEAWKNEFSHIAGNAEFKGHQKLRGYASGGPSNYPLDTLEEKIHFYCSLGFSGVKLGTGAYYKNGDFIIHNEPAAAADVEAKKAQFVREKFGNDLWLMFDAHMGNSPGVTWGLETATAVAKALEPFNLLFLEEPL